MAIDEYNSYGRDKNPLEKDLLDKQYYLREKLICKQGEAAPLRGWSEG